ncbi:MAG: DEAD/DEAH box helicase [Clostridia bacterium]|nr:DEAD/DEAH box helicase [Clostridia bacterium]
MKKNNQTDIDVYGFMGQFDEYTRYFLACEKGEAEFDNIKCNKVIIKIFNSILFEPDRKIKSKKVNYLVFWLNFIIEFRHRQLDEPLLTTVITVIDKFDLQQLIKFTSPELKQDFKAKLNYELRKILDDEMALTDSQTDMFLSVLSKKNMVVSAPTSYGKTRMVLRALLISLEQGFINNFVVVLPTKSLINEYRKIINDYSHEKNCEISVTEAPYIRPKDYKTVFLFTQERFLIFNDTFNGYIFDYAVIDEAQELANIAKSDSARSVLLAKTVSIIALKKTPMVFLMPYIYKPYKSFIAKFINFENDSLVVIDNLFSPTSSKKFTICKEHGKYVMSDVTYNRGSYIEPFDVSLPVDTDMEEDTVESAKRDLFKICSCKYINCLNEKNLYYCRKDFTSIFAQNFAKNLKPIENKSNRFKALIKYLSDYIDEDFELIKFMERGVCIHTGDLDDFTKRQIEKIFLDEGSGLNHIFCTSTLLRGVNLNANNLFFLSQKGRFDNQEFDIKNLFGRVGRLGNCLQGNIYRFYTETRAVKFDKLKVELNASSDPYEIPPKKFDISKEKKSRALITYLQDKEINNEITNPFNLKYDNVNCFDYFLGYEESQKVNDKIKKLTDAERNEIIKALKLSNYECYSNTVEHLSEIYDWASSEDDTDLKRMMHLNFTTRLFYNVAIGMSIKQMVKGEFEYNERKERKPYIVKYQGRQEVQFLDWEKAKNNEYIIRSYTEADKNLLIYRTMRNVSNLIEFKLKIYLQDLYYRLNQLTDERSQDLESFLTHSVVGDPRKLSLKNLGIIDDFAINALYNKDEFFVEDQPNLNAILKYTDTLPVDDPLKYAIQDVFTK